MYEQSTDILGQARFVTVWTRFANDFHTIVVRFQVRSNTVCYGLVQLNTTLTRLTGHLQGLHTVPPTFVRVMLELSHICVCFDINWLVLMAWLHKFSNFQQKSYKNGRWQNKGIRNHDKTDRHWDYFGQKARGETRTSQQKERRRRQVWTREWLNRRVMFGQYDTLLHELNREDTRLQELPPCWCWLVSGVCETCRATNNHSTTTTRASYPWSFWHWKMPTTSLYGYQWRTKTMP